MQIPFSHFWNHYLSGLIKVRVKSIIKNTTKFYEDNPLICPICLVELDVMDGYYSFKGTYISKRTKKVYKKPVSIKVVMHQNFLRKLKKDYLIQNIFDIQRRYEMDRLELLDNLSVSQATARLKYRILEKDKDIQRYQNMLTKLHNFSPII